MRKSIYIRNFTTTAVIVLLSFAVLGAMFFAWSYRLVMNERLSARSATAEEVERSLSAYSRQWDLSALDVRMALSIMSNISGFDILVADTEGTVISCSDNEVFCGHIGKAVPASVLSQMAGPAKYSRSTDLGGVYGELRYVVGMSILREDDNRIIGYVFLSGVAGSAYGIWKQFAVVFLLIALVVMFITFTVSLITTKKQAEPINQMARAALRFARGDFSTRVDATGRVDEIGQLTQAFNTMADGLERSEKLRREFIANVSHELKTPMTVIAGFADGILDGTIPRENEDQYLSVISSETRRLSRLVRSMLDMSQLQSADTEAIRRGSFDIAEVIRLTLLSLDGKITARSLDVDAKLPEEAVVTKGDKDSITQVVFNLIDNAVKFAAEGSVLRINLWKKGGRAFVSVENTGETIPEEEMRLIFDRFHKTDRSRSENRDGVGLGLYIVKTILDSHDEDIFVTSRDGITRFEFSLTIAGQSPEPGRGK